MDSRVGVHVVVGGFPPGSSAAHDMDYARLRLLELLAERDDVRITVASDYADVERWLDASRLLVTYVAGPYPMGAQLDRLDRWLREGGRWLALHGTSGGKSVPFERDGRAGRAMVRMPHHDALGCFFLNHPPIRRIPVDVQRDHPLAQGLPARFEVEDELYFIELTRPRESRLLLTTKLASDPQPGFGFGYERDTSLLDDGETRALGYTLPVGLGEVAYVALGHCHSPSTNWQPFVDASVAADGKTPLSFQGPWTRAPFLALLRNALGWGVASR